MNTASYERGSPKFHSSFGHVLFRHRRVLENVCLIVTNKAIQIFFFAIDALQNRRSREQLESAAHQEPFIRTMLDSPASSGIDRGNSNPAPSFSFDLGDTILESRSRRFQRHRESPRQHQQREPAHVQTRYQR
jgi:hypothetical protein